MRGRREQEVGQMTSRHCPFSFLLDVLVPILKTDRPIRNQSHLLYRQISEF